MTETEGGEKLSLRRSTASAEERRAAAAAMGSASTEKKRNAVARNGFKPGNKLGGRKKKPLRDIACSCGAGQVMTGHKWDCHLKRAIERRQADGATVEELEVELETGLVAQPEQPEGESDE